MLHSVRWCDYARLTLFKVINIGTNQKPIMRLLVNFLIVTICLSSIFSETTYWSKITGLSAFYQRQFRLKPSQSGTNGHKCWSHKTRVPLLQLVNTTWTKISWKTLKHEYVRFILYISLLCCFTF